MKRLKIKYNEIACKSNIYKAFVNSATGKRKRRQVKQVFKNLEFYANKICAMLKDKTYKPSPYIQKRTFEGSSHKERIIFKPRYNPDQIIHHALMNVIEPYLRRKMYYYSCSSIQGKGIHFGANRIKKILKKDYKGTKYCFKLDIRKFYPSVDKELLKTKFRGIIKDKDIQWLINTIIDSHEQGIPIGNYTSQWFANFYLHDLDMAIIHELKPHYYLRYADDMVIIDSNKRRLHKIKDFIEKFLLEKEHLIMKDNWQIFRLDSRPLDFLGYKFYKKNSILKCGNDKAIKPFTTLRGKIFLRITRRIRKIAKKVRMTYSDAATSISYYGWFIHCNFRKFYEKYIKPFIDLKKAKGVIRKWQRQQLMKDQSKGSKSKECLTMV